eukprot:3672886-Amphidinium_carterae.1
MDQRVPADAAQDRGANRLSWPCGGAIILSRSALVSPDVYQGFYSGCLSLRAQKAHEHNL